MSPTVVRRLLSVAIGVVITLTIVGATSALGDKMAGDIRRGLQQTFVDVVQTEESATAVIIAGGTTFT